MKYEKIIFATTCIHVTNDMFRDIAFDAAMQEP